MLPAAGIGSELVRFLSNLAELLFSLGLPYGIVWVGGWFLAAFYVRFRGGRPISAIVGAAFALGFVIAGSDNVELLPSDLEVRNNGLFVVVQIFASLFIAAMLLWMRWVILQRRTVEHVRLYAPVYLFPIFVLGVIPYAWLATWVGERTAFLIYQF